MTSKLERILGVDRVRERATRLGNDVLVFADFRGTVVAAAAACSNGIRLERRSRDTVAILMSTLDSDGTLTMALRCFVDNTGRQRGRGHYRASEAFGVLSFAEGDEQPLIDALLDTLVTVPVDYWDRRE